MAKQSKELKEYLKEIGSKGGKKAWKDISKEEKSRIMSERRKKGLKKKKFKYPDDDETMGYSGYDEYKNED